MPAAMRPHVPMDAGIIIMAFQRDEPLAADDHMSSLAMFTIFWLVGMVTPSALSTSGALSLYIMPIASTLSLAMSISTAWRAYIAPLAPVIATSTLILTTLIFYIRDPSRVLRVVVLAAHNLCCGTTLRCRVAI